MCVHELVCDCVCVSVYVCANVVNESVESGIQ